jgi:hypothetical protein
MAASDNISGQFNMFTGELDPVQPSAPLPEIAKREKEERKYYRRSSVYEPSQPRGFSAISEKDTPAGRGEFVWTGKKRLYHGGPYHITGGIVQPTSTGSGDRFDDLVAFASADRHVAQAYRDGANGGRLFSYIHEVEPLGPVEREDKAQSIVASRFGFKVIGSHMITHDGRFIPNRTIKRNNEPRIKPEGSLPDFDEITIGKKTTNRSQANRDFVRLQKRHSYREPTPKEKSVILEYHNKLMPDDQLTSTKDLDEYGYYPLDNPLGRE